MLDRGPRHAGVAAGQHLPHLVDAELREHLTLACGVANPGHTILTIAAEKLTPAAGPPDRPRCSSPPTTRRSVATTR